MSDQGAVNNGTQNTSTDPYAVGPNSEIGGMHGASIDPNTPRRTAPKQKKKVDTAKKRNIPENKNGDTQQTVLETVVTQKKKSSTVPATRSIDLVPTSFFSEAEKIVRVAMIAELGADTILKEIDEKGDDAIYWYDAGGNQVPVQYNMKYLADVQETAAREIYTTTNVVTRKVVKTENDGVIEERVDAIVNYADTFLNRGMR